MISTSAITEADILNEVVKASTRAFSRQVAEEFLSFGFDDAATTRIRELLQKNNEGSISGDEKLTLDSFLRVGMFLDLLQAKARASLQESGLNE